MITVVPEQIALGRRMCEQRERCMNRPEVIVEIVYDARGHATEQTQLIIERLGGGLLRHLRDLGSHHAH